jgi:Tol biopolymer transport system component
MVHRVFKLFPFVAFALVSIGSAADAPKPAVTGRELVKGHSSRAHLSADGRFVAFDSYATNLVAGDTSQISRVLIHDRSNATTKVINATEGGVPANGASVAAVLTADGRYVAFASEAANLVPGDTNLFRDIFVRDLNTGKTERVSVHSDGTEAVNGHSSSPSISADGRYVAFESAALNLVGGDTNGFIDIFVHDREKHTTIRVNVSTEKYQALGGQSYHPSISGDGRYVVFVSDATNLVAGDTNKVPDIFVHDRVKGTTKRVSVASDGAEGVGGASTQPAISADGRYVAFVSEATNLVPGDTNGLADIFVHDMDKGTTQRVNVATGGTQAVGGHSFYPALNADGRFVAFLSDAANLVPKDTNGSWDIFVRDRQTGATERVSVASDSTQADAGSARASLSADGRYVAFESGASNLVPGDTNGVVDIFVHDRQTKKTARVSVLTDEVASKTGAQPQSKGEQKK